MKKHLFRGLTTVLLSVFALSLNAQSFYSDSYKMRNNGTYEKGNTIASLSYGFGFNHGFKNNFYKADGALGPFYAHLENAVMDELGVGFKMAAGFSYGKHLGHQFNANGFGLGVHAVYHFNKLLPWNFLDVYVGAGVAGRYNIITFERNMLDGKDEFAFDPDVFVGARFYFVPQFAFFVQGGYDGMSHTQVGLSFKF